MSQYDHRFTRDEAEQVIRQLSEISTPVGLASS
jgi:hypothetical protein